jgi:hypothetical protein
MTTSVLTDVSTAPAKPVPWHRMAWVAWRRYRTTLLGTGALLVVLCGFLIARGHQMRGAYATVLACSPHASGRCGFAFSQFHDTYGNTGLLGALFVWVPAIIGAFAGAPLLARELESGTFRYAWTQGAGRTRWMVGLTAGGVLGVAVLGGAFGLVVSWFQQPLLHAGIEFRLHASVFPVTGVAVVGWAVFAFALGVFAGLVVRRVVAALAVTFVAWTGMAFFAGNVLRDRYSPPLVTSSLQTGPANFVVDQWWTKGGVRVTNAQIDQALQSAGVPTIDGGNVQATPGNNSVDPVQYLIQHGYTQLTSYQPDSRYWKFQWIEFGWLMLLSAVLLGASVWLLRRRPA